MRLPYLYVSVIDREPLLVYNTANILFFGMLATNIHRVRDLLVFDWISIFQVVYPSKAVIDSMQFFYLLQAIA